MKLRVGVLQFNIALGDRAKNLETLKRSLKTYLTQSDLPTALVIPEIWDVGYALDRAEELADPEGKSSAEFLGNLARQYGIWFAGGTILSSTGGSGFANRGQVINPDGELVAQYDKVHLIRLMDEDKYFTPGKEKCIFEIEGIRGGYMTCYDIRFCEWVRAYALEGIKILFVGAQWPESRIEHWEVLLRARAIENQIYIVACNRCGITEGSRFGGRSMIIGPKGEILFKAGDGEEAGFAELDTDEVDSTRKFLTVFDDRVPELYGKLAEKTLAQ